MGFTQQQRERILAAIQSRAPHLGNCPVCKNETWELMDSFFFFTAQSESTKLRLGGPGIACVAAVCTNCGNTQFLNALVLGLQDMLEKPEEG